MADEPPTGTTDGQETPPACLFCGAPATWQSPTGHWFCAEDRQRYQDVIPHTGLEPVDLLALMSGERPEEDWLVAPVLPAGKLVGIVARRDAGKSLLLLDMAAALASGQRTLSQPAGEPINVIYVDMEMGPDDLYERLADLGYLPDHLRFDALVQHLHYYQLVALPPLDTEAGGQALEDLVDRHGALLVVIDTVSRVVSGEENSAEPYRDLFRHTETRLKRRRVTLARLDHLGKDKERGSRGSSAKEDPLDVVWHLIRTITGTIELTLTKGRPGWIPKIVTIHKQEQSDGTFAHVIPHEETPDWLDELVERINTLGLPPTTGVNKTFLALKEAGIGSMRSRVSQAVRLRKGTKQSGTKNFSTTPEPLFSTTPSTTGYHPPETHINIDKNLSTTLSTTQVPVVLVDPPSKGGYHPVPDNSEDDFDPDFDLLTLDDDSEEQ